MNRSPRPDHLLDYQSDILTIDYLSKIPSEVPAGRVVVHNDVVPTRQLGSRGFRAWLAEPSEQLRVCGFDWAPELGEHYRIRRAPGVARIPPYSYGRGMETQ